MKKRLTGVVTSDKGDKTLRVEIERRYRHAMYGKIVRGRTVCYVHDDGNLAHEGAVGGEHRVPPPVQDQAVGPGAGGRECRGGGWLKGPHSEVGRRGDPLPRRVKS